MRWLTKKIGSFLFCKEPRSCRGGAACSRLPTRAESERAAARAAARRAAPQLQTVHGGRACESHALQSCYSVVVRQVQVSLVRHGVRAGLAGVQQQRRAAPGPPRNPGHGRSSCSGVGPPHEAGCCPATLGDMHSEADIPKPSPSTAHVQETYSCRFVVRGPDVMPANGSGAGGRLGVALLLLSLAQFGACLFNVEKGGLKVSAALCMHLPRHLRHAGSVQAAAGPSPPCADHFPFHRQVQVPKGL